MPKIRLKSKGICEAWKVLSFSTEQRVLIYNKIGNLSTPRKVVIRYTEIRLYVLEKLLVKNLKKSKSFIFLLFLCVLL